MEVITCISRNGNLDSFILLRPNQSTLAPHIHHGPAEGYVFDGILELRGGPEKGGALCIKDGFLYEATGADHAATKMLADTTFILQMIGPLTWILNDGIHEVQTYIDAVELWEKQTKNSLS
ncbi:MAG: Acetylacetone-cleaving enzyme [Acinetobacter bereziniae]|uniref:Acetylacetone-cleaving enzyme n=1 Tax=Acinetobacter bereziniae TaxID=106648 RepID=A0A833PAK2_ACIBZ|nr:MAG: Acetylacetone-cleaving enzyme [Acinetobacter bereziniae]